MEEWENLREEIMVEFHEDFYEIEVMPDGIVIFFKNHFQKRHFDILNILKEMFDMDKIFIEISPSWFKEFEEDEAEEITVTKMLIQYMNKWLEE